MVPHGCAGSPTIKIRVQIPEGVIATEAKPVPGWNVETIKGKYAGEYDYHGAKVSEGVKEVVWSGGKLPDKIHDEFVIETLLTDGLKPNTTLYFPVVQECEQGVSRWIEIPADGATHSHEEQMAGARRQADAETVMQVLAACADRILLACGLRARRLASRTPRWCRPSPATARVGGGAEAGSSCASTRR